MIVLDTNVLSELLKLHAEPRVLEWLGQLPRSAVFTTSITQAEILYGLRVMPDGRRRAVLEDAVQAIFREDFRDRVLPFDSNAAEAFSIIAAERRQLGKPIAQLDAQIAAIARSRGARLATRNARDFVHCGVVVLDPWASSK